MPTTASHHISTLNTEQNQERHEDYEEKKSEKQTLLELVNNGLDSDLFKMTYPEFIKSIQDAIPETSLLKGKANVSAEGNIAESKSTKTLHGFSMEDEEIRAFSGLLRLKDVINATDTDYETFIACQVEMRKPVLTRESFNKMRKYVEKTLTTRESCAAAIWSIICNDLGKVHEVIAEYEKLPNKKTIGHDLLLAEMLELKPQIFPGFSGLPKEYRAQIIAGYASGCDISQFEQFELPIVALDKLKTLSKESLELYILHSIFDVAGAAAHFKSNGSLTMHEETWQFFDATRHCLEQLSDEKYTIEDAYKAYLDFRGKCINIPPDSEESVALIRIASLARLATPQQGKMLVDVWQKLPDQNRKTLIRELNIHGGQGVRAIFIGYGVAMLLNPQGALHRELTDKAKLSGSTVSPEQRSEATREGLRLGLINIARVFDLTREKLGNDSTQEVFVAECDLIARALNKDPKQSLTMELSIKSSCKRRFDLSLKSSSSNQIPASNGWNRTAVVAGAVTFCAATLFAVSRYFKAEPNDSGLTPKL